MSTSRLCTLPDNLLRADNDMFHHLNNPIYGVLIDSIINDFLIKKCGYNTHSYPRTALVASTYCDYFGSVAYPNMLDVGLRVVKLGNNSVTYECGIFEEEREQVKAVGGFTQICKSLLVGVNCGQRDHHTDCGIDAHGRVYWRSSTKSFRKVDLAKCPVLS